MHQATTCSCCLWTRWKLVPPLARRVAIAQASGIPMRVAVGRNERLATTIGEVSPPTGRSRRRGATLKSRFGYLTSDDAARAVTAALVINPVALDRVTDARADAFAFHEA